MQRNTNPWILPGPLRKGISDIHLGEEPPTFTGIPKEWDALCGTASAPQPGSGPAATQNTLRDPWEGQGIPGRGQGTPKREGTDPCAAPQAPIQAPAQPMGIPSLSQSIPGAAQVGSAQPRGVKHVRNSSWEHKFHHSQRMLHTCPGRALQEPFPFARFP